MRLSAGRRVVFAIVTLVIGLGAVEGLLRVAMPPARRASLPNETIQTHLAGGAFRFDADLGWYWADPGVGGSPVNAYGFVRNKAMTQQKPPGVTRVITFGDSQTFGAGLGPDETYSARAEEALGPGWEVLNAGLSGYRTMNIYRLLRLKMLAFQPDAIVIDCMPYDSPRDDGTLEGAPMRATYTDTLRGWMWNSRLYYVMRLGLEKIRPDRARWLDQGPVPQAPNGVMPNVPGQERSALGNHDLIARWGRDHGIEVFFMQYPIMDERGAYGCMTGVGELPSDSRQIPTCERLPKVGPPAPEFFQDRNHLTAPGARAVGQIVAESLREWRPAPG